MFLVTGASGLLGVNLIKSLRDKGLDVLALYNRQPIKLTGVHCKKLELTNRELIKRVLKLYKPSWIIHCAAVTDVDYCERYPDDAWKVNCEVTNHLSSCAQEMDIGFAYISTDSVFNGKIGNYNENDKTDPLNIYAKTKLCGENVVKNNNNKNYIIRTNIYGWSLQGKKSLTEWLISKLEANEIITGFEDVIFSPVLVNDLVKIMIELMQQKEYGLYHVASSDYYSKYEFAIILAEVFGFDHKLIKPVSINSKDLLAPRPKNTTLCSDKICRTHNMVMPDVESGLYRLKELKESGYIQDLKNVKGV